MDSLQSFWQTQSRQARVGLVAGTLLIAAALVAAMVWAFKPTYQVLFSDLKPQDTAAMVSELERMKVAYKIGPDGNTIWVDGAVVHATRLKLMGRDIPLHGTAGFELFNNSDFGMTEFAQKINYQRALQGEITRTILSLAEIKNARVHLVLPEEGLFKSSRGRAKAGVEITLKPGQTLRGEQVMGIQRLVAAAVPGVSAQDVTIVDQQGVVLSRTAGEGAEADIGSGRLELKKETEKLLARKATEVLEKVFGAGQVLASVDVTLNMDQMRVTTEDVLGSGARGGGASTGVVVREKEAIQDAAPPLGRADGSPAGSNQREVEYQVGRRVEQLSVQPGAIRQLQVVAVISQPLNDTQVEDMKKLVAAAVGLSPQRGDVVVVESLKTAAPRPAATTGAALPPAAAEPELAAALGAVAPPGLIKAAAVALVLLVLAAVVALLWPRKVRGPAPLNDEQRQKMLEQLEQWIEHGAAARAAPVTRGAP